MPIFNPRKQKLKAASGKPALAKPFRFNRLAARRPNDDHPSAVGRLRSRGVARSVVRGAVRGAVQGSASGEWEERLASPS